MFLWNVSFLMERERESYVNPQPFFEKYNRKKKKGLRKDIYKKFNPTQYSLEVLGRWKN